MARDHRQACALVEGPLAGHAPGFAAHLTGLGYTGGAVHQHLLLLAEVSRWLQQQRLDAGQLSPAGADQFAAEAGRRRGRLVSARSLRPLLGYLHDQGVVPGAWPPGPGTGEQATLSLQYREYLRDVRGLSDATIRCYALYVAGFLALLGERLGDMSGAQVLAAVSRQAGQYPAASMRAVVNADRALLRFLHWAGRIAQPLEAAVPSAARRPAGLPARLDAATVSALLDSCDRRRETGGRDFAVLMLLKRYGVRPVEVCRLELADVRWRSGELVVRGKGGRAEALPLMHDAGEAVAGYLQIRRTPPPGFRTLFLAAGAPPRPMCPQSVYGIVASACARAGVRPASPRSFRHGLGCELLAAGASLAEIGDVLRHKDLATTAVYARADLAALVPLVRPWPANPAEGPA